MTKFVMTLYTFGNDRGTVTEFEAPSGTAACLVRDTEIRSRIHAIRGQAERVVGWSRADRRRRRQEIMHAISWLYATVEAVRET